MPEKTYTLHDLISTLRDREGELHERGVNTSDAAIGVITALGYPITAAGYDQFDSDLTAVGL